MGSLDSLRAAPAPTVSAAPLVFLSTSVAKGDFVVDQAGMMLLEILVDGLTFDR